VRRGEVSDKGVKGGLMQQWGKTDSDRQQRMTSTRWRPEDLSSTDSGRVAPKWEVKCRGAGGQERVCRREGCGGGNVAGHGEVVGDEEYQ
jgi:hypothetical protein